HFGKCSTVVGYQHDAEDAEDPVETRVLEDEPGGIHDPAFDAHEPALAHALLKARDHARRCVDSDRLGAARGREHGKRTRSSGNTEPAVARAPWQALERRRGELARQRLMHRLVDAGVVVPAGWCDVVAHLYRRYLAPLSRNRAAIFAGFDGGASSRLSD